MRDKGERKRQSYWFRRVLSALAGAVALLAAAAAALRALL